MRTIVIDGKCYDWREIRRLRTEQIQAARRNAQLTLFELHQDNRPVSQKSAGSRYRKPSLFKVH